MPHRSPIRSAVVLGTQLALGMGLISALRLEAQQLIGYVSTKDADVSTASDIMDGHAVLMGSVAVTAKDHTAPITLGRGGSVRVCQTSILHLTESRSAPIDPQLASPLLLSLDRGAVEVQMMATSSDALMTPDLRMSVRSGGPLDLRVRVARNGDTCVENRGSQAPTLAVTDPFGEALYELRPGQHVLFEHGSLREVVDHETTPCGCPDAPGMSIADALLAPGSATKTAPAAQAAAQHPFPAAISEGLAPEAALPVAPTGQVHAQATETMSYSAAGDAPVATAPAGSPLAIAPPAGQHDLAHVVGRFFRRLFHHG